LSGASIPSDRVIDGKDAMPLLMGKASEPIRNTYYSFEPYSNLDGIRYNQWKFVIDRRNKTLSYYLFDLNRDPGERTDVSSAHPEIMAEMKILAEHASLSIRNGNPLKEFNRFNF
jgi:hypothetical protein